MQVCLHWLEQHGWTERVYGDANVLVRMNATSVGGLDQAGVLVRGGGELRLRKCDEYPEDWAPRTDNGRLAWEVLHQLVRDVRRDVGTGAGQVLGTVRCTTEAIRKLSERLYTLMCERHGWAEGAGTHNDLTMSWKPVETVANAVPETYSQRGLFGESS